MGSYGSMHTTTTTAETVQDLTRLFDKWSRASGQHYTWSRNLARPGGAGTAHVSVERDGQPVGTFTCSDFWLYAANLRALYGLLDALRLADARGMLGQLVEVGQQFLALSAPLSAASSQEPKLLASPGAEAFWRHLVKAAHLAGDEERIKELNIGREAIQRQYMQLEQVFTGRRRLPQ